MLLRTKLVPPPPLAGLLARAQLTARLSATPVPRLTVVGAPPGYGKTTVVADWFRRQAAAGDRLGWLSVDAGDNDPAQFWRYVVAALRGAGALPAAPEAERPPLPGADLTGEVVAVINDLDADRTPVTLVLDDYHLIRERDCHALLTLLLDRAPPGLHVVIATRSDPPLPLGTLRAAGQLVELRERDLRLSDDESATLLRSEAGLALVDGDLEKLVRRIEGWPAALHLAALWLRGEPDQVEAIRQFAGDNRHLVDYLGEQVLAGLAPGLETFLLRTSILSRFDAALCDAVTAGDDGARRIGEIERANLFLVGLDGRRVWWRYHHLFGDLLRAELAHRRPDEVPVLHARACAWHRAHGTAEEALHHAVLGGDHAAVAAIISGAWPALIRSGRSATLQRWLELARDTIPVAPELAYAGAVAEGLAGAPEANIERWLRIAERAIADGTAPVGRMADGSSSFAVNVEVARATFVYRDVRAAATIAQGVVDREVPGSQWLVAALGTLAFLRHLSGDPGAAAAAATQAITDRDAPRRPHGFIQALGTRALLEVDAGDAEGAARTARRALDLADQVGLAGSLTTCLPHLALGRSLYATGRKDEALDHLVRAVAVVAGRAPVAQHAYAVLALADARHRTGDAVTAHRLADEAAVLLEPFTDAGLLTELEAGLRRRLLTERRRRPAAPGAELSETELSVLRLLAGPQPQRGIATVLYLSQNTVKTHTTSIYRKLGVRSRAEAVEVARARGLLSPG